MIMAYCFVSSLLILLWLSGLYAYAQKENDTFAEKIVGGEESTPGRYDYMAILSTSTAREYCAATLISSEYALSAAHCAGADATLWIGRYDLSVTEVFQVIIVEYQILHPDYNCDTKENDIMVLKLGNDALDLYTPVQLDDGTEDLSSGAAVTVMGWGRTSFEGETSDVLREVELDIVSNTDCNVKYENKITDDMLCAAREGKDACKGDSGGPLIIKGDDASTDIQVGIVSWGRKCAEPGYSGVYSRVSANKDFIECVTDATTTFEYARCGNVIQPAVSFIISTVDLLSYLFTEYYKG